MVLGGDPSPLSTVTLRSPGGRRVSLAAPPKGATVLVFYSTECPISNSYSPTLSTLVDSFPARSVKWLGVCVDPDLSDTEVKAHARDFGLRITVVRDRQGSFARKIGAKVTPEAFVIDDAGRIRYHGRIDDQFAARRKRNANPCGERAQGRDRRRSEWKGRGDAVRRSRRLSVARGSGGRGPPHLLQGRGADPPEELSGMPPARARWARSRSKLTSRRGSALPISPRWSRIE